MCPWQTKCSRKSIRCLIWHRVQPGASTEGPSVGREAPSDTGECPCTVAVCQDILGPWEVEESRPSKCYLVSWSAEAAGLAPQERMASCRCHLQGLSNLGKLMRWERRPRDQEGTRCACSHRLLPPAIHQGQCDRHFHVIHQRCSESVLLGCQSSH